MDPHIFDGVAPTLNRFLAFLGENPGLDLTVVAASVVIWFVKTNSAQGEEHKEIVDFYQQYNEQVKLQNQPRLKHGRLGLGRLEDIQNIGSDIVDWAHRK